MLRINMKGWHFRNYRNDSGKIAYMFIHMNKTVRYILDDESIPSRTGTLEHVDKELKRLGFQLIEEFPVTFETEKHIRKVKRRELRLEKKNKKIK